MAKVIKNYPKAHFHVDAVQAFGKISMDLNNVDSISLSGHKFNGLKGQGVLLVNHVKMLNLLSMVVVEDLGFEKKWNS